MHGVTKGCLIAALTTSLVLISFVAGFATNSFYTLRTAPANAAAARPDEGVTAPDSFDVFWEAWDLLNREFYGELPEGQQVTYAAIRGVLSRLEDPNTILVEPVQHEREREEFSGEFGGIGAYVETDEAGQLVIVSPIDGTPAARADLRAEDIILKVDGVEITGMTTDEAINLIRGEVGTEVTLEILRPGEDEIFTVTLTRDKIPDPTVHHSMIENSTIGYIRMTFFSARTPEELRAAITDLRRQGAESLIVDVRNNPGGLLESAIGTTSQFLADGVIAYEETKDGIRRELTAHKGGVAADIPLIVLVNEGSASASEIFAGALQDRDRAQLIGDQTYGKGTVQIPFTLSDGSSLHVTVAHWLTPDGTDLSEEGLTPDEWVEIDEEDINAGRDPQLEAAIEILSEGEAQK